MTTKVSYSMVSGAPINVLDFGADNTGVSDSTTKIQSAIDATPDGGLVYLPPGVYKISSPLQISKSIHLHSTTDTAAIVCFSCNGIFINKCQKVEITNIEIAQNVRYSSSPNTYIGIYVDGDNLSRPQWHVYDNVFIDGFETGIVTNWIWATLFNKITVLYGKNGLKANGLSVNNQVTNCAFNGDNTGIGLFLDGSSAASEGWMISNSLFYANAIGIFGYGYTHVLVSNCIIDFCYTQGILIQNSPTDFAGNWCIANNYIAMAGGTAAIHQYNTISNFQNRGNQISNNHILSYYGTVCSYGVLLEQAYSINNSICNNSFWKFSVYDIAATHGPTTISNNMCLSTLAVNISAANASVSNNVGVVLKTSAALSTNIGGINYTSSDAAPLTGTWFQGDVCWNIYATAGGTPGWVCVSSGTPGTWKAMANLAA